MPCLCLRLAVLALLATISLAGCSASADSVGAVEPLSGSREAGSIREVGVHDLHAGLASVAVLVDVRTTAEFERGHVPGALHVPLDQVRARLHELEEYRASEVFLICHSGGRSGRAARLLASGG